MTSFIDNPVDWFRMINAVLALSCAGVLLFGKGAPWRNILSTLRLFSFSLALVFLWQTYTSIEVAVTTVSTTGGTGGYRVYGFTFVYTMLLLSLIAEATRGRILRRTHTLAEPIVVVTKPAQTS